MSLSCCCLTSLALTFLGEEVATVERATTSGTIPTGDTPELFPGSPGWLPSGRGLELPDAELDDGPRGLWWYPQAQQTGMVANVELYLADGTYALRPRPGGPKLFDLEGHRRARSTLGTFTLVGDNLTRAYDTFSHTDAFSHGDDDEGPWFNAGAARRRPIEPASSVQLIGTWRSAGTSYRFAADGSVVTGFNTELAVGQHVGAWRLDGYLLQLSPADAPSWVSFIGSTGKGRYLVIGNRLFSRE